MRLPKGLYDLTPPKITLTYAIFGLSWIFWSDLLVMRTFDSAQMIATAQTLKGGLFVALSGAVIWGLTSRREHQLRESQSRITRMSQRLHVLQRVFRHDIRNEMNIIKGNIDLVREQTRSITPEKSLEIASDTVDIVIDISEKLKVLDRYDVETEIEDSVDLVEIADDALIHFEQRHPNVSVDTEMPRGAFVTGDGSIYHIFREILDNSVKHYDGDVGTLEIKFGIEEHPDHVIVTVEDNGPGIPEAEIKALRRGDESSLVHLSGIGLWIVYWLTERLGGIMEIEETSEDGTSISIEFKKPIEIPNLQMVGEEIADLKSRSDSRSTIAND